LLTCALGGPCTNLRRVGQLLRPHCTEPSNRLLRKKLG
jgi:hypothetical protein